MYGGECVTCETQLDGNHDRGEPRRNRGDNIVCESPRLLWNTLDDCFVMAFCRPCRVGEGLDNGLSETRLVWVDASTSRTNDVLAASRLGLDQANMSAGD